MLMKNFLIPSLLLSVASLCGAQSADAPKKTTHTPGSSRDQLKSEAKGLALGTEVAETINDRQLDIAARVLTGRASCEFDQHVNVEPLNERPGMFQVGFKNATYVMVPEETTSGAVRLFDKKSGVVWLQIPSKSMLMNSKLGQRMVDNCTQSEQRAAVNAAQAAGR